MAILPNNNIDTRLVANMIGVNSDDVGVLCGVTPESAAKINKWAKYKPVRYPVDFTEGYPDWWKAENGKCGFSINTYNSPGSFTQPGTFFYQLVNDLDRWEYAPPYGGSASPFRLGDFRNYNSEAIIPIGYPPTTEYYIEGNTIKIPFDVTVSPDDPYNLTISDLKINGVQLSNYYLGGMMRQKSGVSGYIISTSPNPISSGNLLLTMRGLSDDYSGTWSLYPFLSSVPFSGTSMLPSGIFLVSPLVSFSITIKETGTQVQVIALGVFTNPSKSNVEYYLHLENGTPNSITMNNIKVIAMRTRGNTPPASGEVIGSDNFGSEVLGAKSSKILGPCEIQTSYQSGYMYWLAARCDNVGAIIVSTSYNQIEELPPEM